jgi:phosphatidylserine decarboxylase
MVRDGIYYVLAFVAVAVLLGWFTGIWALALIPLLLAAFFGWFFRDPERTIPQAPGAIVSPGDGKVTDIVAVDVNGESRTRISIFLNVLNEQNIVTLEGEGHTVVFKQIAGLLARRIVFSKKVGDMLARGERVGLIKFGSRVDVIFTSASEVSVKIGDHVAGGSTILAVARVGDRQAPVMSESERGGVR